MSGITNKQESLREYVRRILELKGLTETQVSRNSGGKISTSSISDIVTGKRTCTTLSKLQALARGLGVPEEEIFSRARGIKSVVSRETALGIFTRLQTKYLELNDDDKRAILSLVEMLEHEVDYRRSRRLQRQDANPDGAIMKSRDTGGW